MGEAHGRFFEPTFNQPIKLRQADQRITSDAGAILLREIDHRLGLTTDIDERLAGQPSDWRLLRRIAGIKPNLEAVREALPEWVGRHQRAAGHGRKILCGTLDIDPFPIEVHGNQPGGAYHGYYRQTMYYPVVAGFSPGGDCDGPRLGEGFVHAILRRGNAGGAEGGGRFVRETIRKSRDLACHLDVRIDAGLVEGKMLDAIDEEGYAFEYERKRGEDRIEVWVYRDGKMAVRIEWLKIDEEGWRV